MGARVFSNRSCTSYTDSRFSGLSRSRIALMGAKLDSSEKPSKRWRRETHNWTAGKFHGSSHMAVLYTSPRAAWCMVLVNTPCAIAQSLLRFRTS
eukprot:2377020-Rhodomonas_salina.1